MAGPGAWHRRRRRSTARPRRRRRRCAAQHGARSPSACGRERRGRAAASTSGCGRDPPVGSPVRRMWPRSHGCSALSRWRCLVWGNRSIAPQHCLRASLIVGCAWVDMESLACACCRAWVCLCSPSKQLSGGVRQKRRRRLFATHTASSLGCSQLAHTHPASLHDAVITWTVPIGCMQVVLTCATCRHMSSLTLPDV
jgi:hypothetical protein